MPSRWAIVSYWVQQGGFDVELDDPHCFACGLCQPTATANGPVAARWNAAPLDRAHLQDHAQGGPEHVSNLVLLCRLCHKLMPMFQDRDKAITWVLGGCPWYRIPKIADILRARG
jgi:HNH endonuclease